MQAQEVIFTDELLQHPELAQQVQQVTPIVANEIDLATAKAHWDHATDSRGRDLLVFRVEDQLGGEAEAEFAPAELQNEHHLRTRLRELKGAAVLVKQWRDDLQEFLNQLRLWISQMEPQPFVEEVLVELREERSGAYHVPALNIAVEGEMVRVVPVGRWIVGAKGRVDLVANGRETFVLTFENTWCWVSDRREARLIPLSQELFPRLVRDVLQ